MFTNQDFSQHSPETETKENVNIDQNSIRVQKLINKYLTNKYADYI